MNLGTPQRGKNEFKLSNLKTRVTEFTFNIQKRYSLLTDDLNIDQIIEQFDDMEKLHWALGGINDKQTSSELSIETTAYAELQGIKILPNGEKQT